MIGITAGWPDMYPEVFATRVMQYVKIEVNVHDTFSCYRVGIRCAINLNSGIGKCALCMGVNKKTANAHHTQCE